MAISTFLKGSVIATTSGLQYGDPQIRSWVEQAGGIFSANLTAETTHLVASLEAYNAGEGPVKNAKQLKAVEIVSWDWLEDSLMKRTRKSARQYRMHKIASAHRKRDRNAPGGKHKAAMKLARSKGAFGMREMAKLAPRTPKAHAVSVDKGTLSPAK